MCHVSCVICHVSHVTQKKSGLSGEASRSRVCYQRGLRRLVFMIVCVIAELQISQIGMALYSGGCLFVCLVVCLFVCIYYSCSRQQDFPMTFPGLSQDFLWNFSQLSQDFLRTFSGLSHKFIRSFSGLSQNFLSIFSYLSQDIPRTFP